MLASLTLVKLLGSFSRLTADMTAESIAFACSPEGETPMTLEEATEIKEHSEEAFKLYVDHGISGDPALYDLPIGQVFNGNSMKTVEGSQVFLRDLQKNKKEE